MARQPADVAFREEIESIFESAIELASRDRERWLAERCAGDPRLRAEVDALIAGHERAEGILEVNVAAAATAVLDGVERGRRIGAYRVVRELGRGGMGVVYLAERDDGQYEQRVAIKLLRASPDADDLHRRFLAERQILASLQHHGIAQLLDGGVTDGRIPFLVMEYVDGAPITAYSDQRKLDIGERLALFKDVCSAVHYAHQNLIIHRDIKPGNILVSPDGGVKLLDFGIAKLLNPGVSAVDQPRTRTELRAMTPEYASPEQVRGENVTTASDVYALGVVLYELLSGQRPYQLMSGSPQELIEVICVRVPERPSVVAEPRLRHLLRGDLDAIVMMALRKDCADRYGSVDLLWEDIQRHLDGLPVLAHRGSRLYRARKFFGRHRVEAAAATIVTLSLAVGAGVAIRQAMFAARERDRAERALVDAEQSLGQSESVTGFLVGLFDVTTPTPGAAAPTAREVVRRGAMQVERFRGQPLVQARMLEAIARVHMSIAEYPEARAALDRSLALRVEQLGDRHVQVAGSLFYLGEVLRRMGQYQQADSLTRRAVAIRTEALGPRHPANAEALAQLAGIAIYRSDLRGAEEMSRRALEIRRESLGANDPLIAASLELHASHLRRLGNTAGAEAELREGIAVYRAGGGPTSPDAAYLELRLADVIFEGRGDTAQAESLIRSALAMTRASLGEDHPRTSWAMGDLSDLLAQKGEFAEAEQLARSGLAIMRRAFGDHHPNVADFQRVLVSVHVRAGRLAEAEKGQRESIAVLEKAFGPRHAAYAGALGALSDILMGLHRYDEAIIATRKMIDIRRSLFGEEGAGHGIDLSRMARLYAHTRDFRTADSLFRLALDNQRKYVPDNHYDVRNIYTLMAERYGLEGNRSEQLRYARMAQPR